MLQSIFHILNRNNQAALATMSNFIIFFYSSQQSMIRFHVRSVWRFPRSSPIVDQVLLTGHLEKEFTRRFRVKRSTFYYICSLVAPMMQKSNKGGGIPLENRVGVSLQRLGTGNYLLGCADLFGMSEGAACIAVRQFCKAVLKLIRPIVVPKFTKEALPELAERFQSKHGIPFIMGAIDGSHIPVIAPPGDPAPFYNRKGFYSILLQGIVDMDTRFWDWDFGWAGSLHDYTLFVNSIQGIKSNEGRYFPYKLIGDAAYPCRTSMYVPFKGSKEQLEPYKAHWNFIQSSTRMCVERAFGLLKGRWRILLRRIEMNIENISDVVGACICLHNLCVMHKDFGDDTLLEEAQQWLHLQHISSFGNLRETGTMKIFDYGKSEINRMRVDVEELIRKAGLEGEHDPFLVGDIVDRSTVLALKNGVTMHTQLAKQLFERHLKEQVLLPTEFNVEDSESSDYIHTP